MKMKKGPLKGKVYTDKDWNDENTVSDGPYQYSKVLAMRTTLQIPLQWLVDMSNCACCNMLTQIKVQCDG